jgi:hypothetical protein
MIFAHVLRLLLVNPRCLLIQSAMIDIHPQKSTLFFKWHLAKFQLTTHGPLAPRLQAQRIRVQGAKPQVLCKSECPSFC